MAVPITLILFDVRNSFVEGHLGEQYDLFLEMYFGLAFLGVTLREEDPADREGEVEYSLEVFLVVFFDGYFLVEVCEGPFESLETGLFSILCPLKPWQPILLSF